VLRSRCLSKCGGDKATRPRDIRAPFNGKLVRIAAVGQVLTDSSIPKRYWSDLRRKLEKESGQAYEKIVRLKMTAAFDQASTHD
jgi:hypothetical protein